jgi:hypothetical protein
MRRGLQLVSGHQLMKSENNGNNLDVGAQPAQNNNAQLVMQDGKKLSSAP